MQSDFLVVGFSFFVPMNIYFPAGISQRAAIYHALLDGKMQDVGSVLFRLFTREGDEGRENESRADSGGTPLDVWRSYHRSMRFQAAKAVPGPLWGQCPRRQL